MLILGADREFAYKLKNSISVVTRMAKRASWPIRVKQKMHFALAGLAFY